MTIYNGIFPLGLGTNRFPVNGADDFRGVEQAVSLVLQALNAGVSYIDTQYTYSHGMSYPILKKAFEITKKPYNVTLKSGPKQDKTADDTRRRIEFALVNMGITRAAYFLVWSLGSLDEFHFAMKPGGIYDTALKLKDEKVIDHICCSMHAPVKDMIKIIESGAFEGVTVSYSLLNSTVMAPVLNAARIRNIGVVAMNPLGGGVIPQNSDFFNFARSEEYEDKSESVSHAALRFISANDAIKIVLSGISNEEELQENLEAFTSSSHEPGTKRIERVNRYLSRIENYCTGCDYCAGCPVNIPVSSIMYARNVLTFSKKKYDNEECELSQDTELFRKLKLQFSFMPETAENPCVKCGECENKCTQKLKICGAIEDTYKRASKRGFFVSYWKDRLDSLLNAKKYRSVGFYPSGGYLSKALVLYRNFFGELPFSNKMLFDSNPALWGQTLYGMKIYPPNEISSLRPDCILICNYNYQSEIQNSLQKYKNDIDILRLHEDGNVPLF